MKELDKKLSALKDHKKALEDEIKALSSEIKEKEEAFSLLEEKRNILKSKQSSLASSTIEQISFDIQLRKENLNDITTKCSFLELELLDTEDAISKLEAGIEPYIKEQIDEMFEKFLKYIEDNVNILAYNITTIFYVDAIGRHIHVLSGFIPSGKFGIFSKGWGEYEHPIVECCNFDFGEPLCSYSKDGLIVQTDWYIDFEETFYRLFFNKLRDNSTVFNDSFTIRIKDKNTFSLELL